MDGTSFSCNGLTGGNQCIVFDPYGIEYFRVISGTTLAILEWNGFNLAGTFPSTINFVGGYVETVGVKTRRRSLRARCNVTSPNPLLCFCSAQACWAWLRCHGAG